MKQFLLRPDGSFPPHTDVEALKKAGVRFVLPTKPPRPRPGMMVMDTEPIEVDGIWRQQWTEVPAPPPEETQE
jgi:hypothetical protein